MTLNSWAMWMAESQEQNAVTALQGSQMNGLSDLLEQPLSGVLSLHAYSVQCLQPSPAKAQTDCLTCRTSQPARLVWPLTTPKGNNSIEHPFIRGGGTRTESPDSEMTINQAFFQHPVCLTTCIVDGFCIQSAIITQWIVAR